jgi:hypothetical protein
MGKQTKKKLAILLTFCFVILLTSTAVSTGQTAYQDTEWLSSALSHLNTIYNDVSVLSNITLNNDMTNLRMYGTALNIDSQNALVDSKLYSVSTNLQPAKNEYEALLSDFSQYGNYEAKGATESQNGESEQADKDFVTAKTYLRSSIIHCENFYNYASLNKS